MIRFLLLALLVASSTASAVVIRDDVDDSKYRVPASEFPALVDMPGEGHGVLIAPQWIITAAHVVAWQPEIKEVVLDGIPREVERLVMHPGYKKPPHELIHQALTTGDAILVMALLASSDDIALLKLTQPVTDVAPVAMYKDSDELGQIIKIVGKVLRVQEPLGTTPMAQIARSFAARSIRSPVPMTGGFAMCSTSRRRPCLLRACSETGTVAVLRSSKSRKSGC